jgi:hypothetical protein
VMVLFAFGGAFAAVGIVVRNFRHGVLRAPVKPARCSE